MTLFELFESALVFATIKHKGQKRLDGEDYINHPKRVHDLVCRGLQSPICTVAILHDIIEDTDTTFWDLYEMFGPEVADAVAILTKDEGENYEEYIQQLKDSNNGYAITVKVADLYDNLNTIDNVPDLDKRNRLKSRYEKALKELTVT